MAQVKRLFEWARANWVVFAILVVLWGGVYLLWSGPKRSQPPPSLSVGDVALVPSAFGGHQFYFTRSRQDVIEILMYDSQAAKTVDISQSKSLNLQPVLAPNGKSIAFISDRDAPGIFQVYVVSKPGEAARRLTIPDDLNGHQVIPDTIIAWSPSSLYVAFVAEKGDGRQLFTANTSGHLVAQVTHDPGAYITGVVWLNDTSLIFVSDREGGAPRFWSVDRDGNNLALFDIK